jgi:hypothetical protein
VLCSRGLAGSADRVGDRAAATLSAGAAAAEPVPTCAGSCPGCDLVAGCRDQQPAQSDAPDQSHA